MPTMIQLRSGGQAFAVQESVADIADELNNAPQPDAWVVVTVESGRTLGIRANDVQRLFEQ